ncbi:hypothetical protein DFJ58DRAFT_729085 [Suillus subalutaceus]|uniref:uncharacterized protein n=1 Tax=Suillus subalutaceus TaxID=48586 RepID=UPI001B85C001|nr:uncharacterized protein DFJ58DRAFT_729085 [Suillus subalutaceus]KAG1851098.1 hypothetical protein DFJ58DRAFT_729085 [Suillus subalutaceus]
MAFTSLHIMQHRIIAINSLRFLGLSKKPVTVPSRIFVLIIFTPNSLDQMGDIQYSLDLFKHLGRRSVLPLVSSPSLTVRVQAAVTGDLPDLNNVQGDVIYLFPKKAENFVFFRINNVTSFRTALQSFKPTTAEDVKDNLTKIAFAKANARDASSVLTVDIAQYQIAFTRTGMYFLGVNEETGDTMGPYIVKPKPDPVNGSVRDDTGALHGVITVAGSSAETCTKASNDVIDLFGSSITGMSISAFKMESPNLVYGGLVIPRPGQIQVDPGVIIMGYPGDPVRDDPTTKLEQSVISFEDYVQRNGPRWREFIPGGNISPPLNKQEAEDLFGARLIGRWNRYDSGAPLAKCPFRDNQAVARDPDLNNDFDYIVRDNPNISQYEPSDYYCPFTAHTRKTAPRNLNPYIDAKFLESGSIVRGGLPYGGEVTDQERRDVANGSPELPRGLLFNCYMSSLDSGFVRQTIGYAGNDYWPITSLVPQKKGQDPVLGSPPVYTPAQIEGTSPSVQSGDKVNLQLTGADGATFQVSGFAEVTVKGAAPPPVVRRDIVFLLDATGSMQVYIEQVRDTIQSLCERLVATGKWSGGDLRFGLIAFRDHPPQDSTYITRQYPFDSNVLAVKANLANLQADGGGDGPEAQCDAFARVLNAGWKDEATKVAILITDSPPHGIGEDEDGFPGGCPLQNDPVRLVNRMARLGITLHVLACEPTMSMDFSTPLDFYKGIVQKTGGRFFPLSDVNSLIGLSTGSILENADIRRPSCQNIQIEVCNIKLRSRKHKTGDISKDLYGRLSSSCSGQTPHCLRDIYAANEQGDKNVQIWLNAENKSTTNTTSPDQRGYWFPPLKREYRQGWTPAMSSKIQPVSLNQVCDFSHSPVSK